MTVLVFRVSAVRNFGIAEEMATDSRNVRLPINQPGLQPRSDTPRTKQVFGVRAALFVFCILLALSTGRRIREQFKRFL